MIPFYSKRNQVYPVMFQGRMAVEKHFQHQEDWARERYIYQTLPLPHPELLAAEPGRLITAFCPYPTLLEVLESQERGSFSPEPWQKLSAWLTACDALLNRLPGEGNLRNFLWDPESNAIIGLDFECYRPVGLSACGTLAIAAILEYAPTDTPVKRQASMILAKQLGVSETQVNTERKTLRNRRNAKPPRILSGIILAGGHSRRMGQNKADLRLNGKTLLEHQIQKLQDLGIEDILLSGAACPHISGTRVIPDELPDRGPLGGLHACLRAATTSSCLVLSVDVPLVPTSALAHLCRRHEKGITVLSHHGKQEPLIGVYDRDVADCIALLIAEDGAPVRALGRNIQWDTFEYLGPEELLMNCNTPEEFSRIQSLAQTFL